MGKVIKMIVAISFTIFFGLFGCNGEDLTIIIKKPTELLKKADVKDAPGNEAVSLLQKGVRGNVIHVRYTKDFMFYKIQVADGREGYVISGDNLLISP